MVCKCCDEDYYAKEKRSLHRQRDRNMSLLYGPIKIKSGPWPYPVQPHNKLLAIAQRHREKVVTTEFRWQDDKCCDTVERFNYCQIFRQAVRAKDVEVHGFDKAKRCAFNRLCYDIERVLNHGERGQSGTRRSSNGIRAMLGREYREGDILVLKELRPAHYIGYRSLEDANHGTGDYGEFIFEGGLMATAGVGYGEGASLRSCSCCRRTLTGYDSAGRPVVTACHEISRTLIEISNRGGTYGFDVERSVRKWLQQTAKDYAIRRVSDPSYPGVVKWVVGDKDFTPSDMARNL